MKHLLSARAILAGCLFTVAATGSVWGQSTTQGAISGTVFDATNAAIPNAKVVIVNNGTNAEQTLTTGESGGYKAPLLAPGTYTVTISAPGFGETKSTGVVVQVQTVTELNPHLNAGSETTSVEVQADLPVIQFDSASFGGHLSNTEIENIPINNRRWSSLALVTPGVTNDASGFGLLSFRAIASVLNNVQIDGTDDNQAFFGEERGRTRAGYSTSQAAVREFQVNTGVYSAEFGRAVGGVVNSVTKSGSNALHGEVYFYRRDDFLSSINPKVTFPSYNAATGITTLIPYRPKDKRNQYGFGVGGPLIKDKLFWFYAFDEFRRNFPGAAVAANPASFFAAPTGAALTSLAAIGATAAQYNAVITDLATDLGNVPRQGNQDINTPKLDWQINSKHHVSFLYHRLRWDSPGGVQTQAALAYSRDAFGTDFVKLDYGVAKLDSLITDHLTNELRYMYGRELNDEGQQTYTDYTLRHLTATNGTVPQINLFTSVGFQLGSPYYSYRTAYPDERKWQIGDTAAFLIGKHGIRFGLDILHNYDLQKTLGSSSAPPNGAYTYGSLVNYVADILKPGGACTASTGNLPTISAAGTLACYSSISQAYGQPNFDLATTDYSFFVQDDWKPVPNLTLNLGIRYDYESVPQPYANLVTAAQTSNSFSDKNNIAPRLGFAYDPFGLGKTVVRGGFGMYFGRVPNALLLNTFAGTGSAQGQSNITYYNTTGIKLPNVLTNAPSAASAAGSIFYFDKHFQNPYAEQFDLTVQQELGLNNVLSLSYLGSLGRELPNYLNTNLDPTKTYTQNYTVVPVSATNASCGYLACGTVLSNTVYANRAVTATGTQFNTLNPAYNAITGIFSNINSNYHALSVDMTNRNWKWISYDVNYTWAHALDYNQQGFTAAGSNNWFDPYGNQKANYSNSSLNIRHRVVGWAILNAPGLKGHSALTYVTNGWSLKPLVQIQSGLPYSVSVSGTGTNQCATVGCLVPFSTGLGGTNVTYIPQLGRNNLYIPRNILVDARVQKDLKLHERYNLQLMAEAFNLANHQNITGVNTTAYAIGTNNVLTPQTNFGTASSSGVNSNYAYGVRQFQFSARVVF
jgi:hypothetical protein